MPSAADAESAEATGGDRVDAAGPADAVLGSADLRGMLERSDVAVVATLTAVSDGLVLDAIDDCCQYLELDFEVEQAGKGPGVGEVFTVLVVSNVNGQERARVEDYPTRTPYFVAVSSLPPRAQFDGFVPTTTESLAPLVDGRPEFATAELPSTAQAATLDAASLLELARGT